VAGTVQETSTNSTAELVKFDHEIGKILAASVAEVMITDYGTRGFWWASLRLISVRTREEVAAASMPSWWRICL